MVDLVTNRPERMLPGTVLDAEGTPLVVSTATHAGRRGERDRWIVSFEGVEDRSGAERLHGRSLRAAALRDPDALWVHDLVGAQVVDQDGRHLGEVQTVEANPASDLLVLPGGVLVPLRFVRDTSPGRVHVEIPPGLVD